MNDEQVLITGATNGIGLAAAEGLAALGANVAIVGRSKAKTRIASARITAVAGRGPTVATFIAGLSSQAAVTVGAKLGASPGPKGPQVGPIVRFMAFAIFFPEQVHGRAPTVT